MGVHRYVLPLAFALASFSAKAQQATPGSVEIYVSYTQWFGMPRPLANAYMAGVLDSMLLYAGNEQQQAISLHFNSCLKRFDMNGGRLSDNVRAFAAERPQFQASVQVALLNYLVSLCGMILDPTAR